MVNPSSHYLAAVIVIVLLITLVAISSCTFDYTNPTTGREVNIEIDESVSDIVDGVIPLLKTENPSSDKEDQLEFDFD